MITSTIILKRMLLNKHEQEKKYALRLLRELNKINRQIRSIEPIKLDVPIQHGYVRYLELNEDAKHRKDYDNLKKAFLLLGQNKAYCKNKDFIRGTGKNRHEVHAHTGILRDPHFAFYYTEEKRAKDLAKIQELRKYLVHHNNLFVCECPSYRPSKTSYKFVPHYVFRYQWLLKEITAPHYLTHYTPVDGELESRRSKISKELWDNRYYTRIEGRRCCWDKSWKENWTAIKYGNGKIYHDLDYIEEEE